MNKRKKGEYLAPKVKVVVAKVESFMIGGSQLRDYEGEEWEDI